MRFYKSILQTSLFKITSLNSFSVVLKIAIGLISSKIIALFIGPSGLALAGNLKNFVGSFETIATLGFQNGIVKYIAENQKNELKLKQHITTIFLTTTATAILLSLLLYVFSFQLNQFVFGSNYNYAFVFKAFAVALPFYANSIVLIAIINGLEKYKSVIYITIIGNCIGLLISTYFIYSYQILGALLAIIVAPAVLFFIALYFINIEFNFFKLIKLKYFDFIILKNLADFSLMAIVAGVFGPMVFLAIRKNVINVVGIEKAGYWVTMDLISSYYLLFVGTILSVYFLPKLVIANDQKSTKTIFWQFYKSIVPVFIVGLVVLYFLRDFILKLIFTKDFLPVSDLFFWQILGDVFRACALILGYNLIAKKHTFMFIIFEILSLTILFCFSFYLLPRFDLEGIVMAHCFTYFIYLLLLGFYFRKSLF